MQSQAMQVAQKSKKAQESKNFCAKNLPAQNLPFCTLESHSFSTKSSFREAIKSHLKSSIKSSAKSTKKSSPKSHAHFCKDSSADSSYSRFYADSRPISYSHRHLNSLLEKILSQKRFKNILLFYPLPFEANILPLLKKLKKNKNKRIFLPTIKGLNFKMLLYRLPLVKNTLGIFEPHLSSYVPNRIDFALIPALGIDKFYARIGMGKGMYDRVFASLSKKQQPKHKMCKTQKICKVFVSQNLYISKLPLCEDFDIRADMYLSYKFAKSQKKGFYNVLDTSYKFFRFRGASRGGGIFYLPKNR